LFRKGRDNAWDSANFSRARYWDWVWWVPSPRLFTDALFERKIRLGLSTNFP
jgi:hypothetical protein